MSNHWVQHDLIPASAIKKGGTHIDVYDDTEENDTVEDENRNEKWDQRMEELKPPNYPPLDQRTKDWEKRHEKAKQRMRSDSSYQFIMMVSAFANLKLDSMWSTPSEEPTNSAVEGSRGIGSLQYKGISEFDNLSREQAFQHRWTTMPEVSGLVYLSPKVYGHLMEAHEIFKNKTHTKIILNKLMTLEKFKTLFARLVALRIKISAFLSGLNYQLDRNYRRLMVQQAMVLNALKNKIQPVSAYTKQYMLTPQQILDNERNFKKYNNISGRFY